MKYIAVIMLVVAMGLCVGCGPDDEVRDTGTDIPHETVVDASDSSMPDTGVMVDAQVDTGTLPMDVARQDVVDAASDLRVADVAAQQ